MWQSLKPSIKKWSGADFVGKPLQILIEEAHTCDGREDYISATQHPSNDEQHKTQQSC